MWLRQQFWFVDGVEVFIALLFEHILSIVFTKKKTQLWWDEVLLVWCINLDTLHLLANTHTVHPRSLLASKFLQNRMPHFAMPLPICVSTVSGKTDGEHRDTMSILVRVASAHCRAKLLDGTFIHHLHAGASSQRKWRWWTGHRRSVWNHSWGVLSHLQVNGTLITITPPLL